MNIPNSNSAALRKQSRSLRWLRQHLRGPVTGMMLVALGLSTLPVTGATVYWDADTGTTGAQDGAGTWNAGSVTFWNNLTDVATTSDITTDTAYFGVGGTGGTINVGTQSITGLILGATAGGGYTFTNTGASTLTLGASGILLSNTAQATTIGSSNLAIAMGAAQTWTNQSSNLLTIGSNVTGTFNLTVSGAGNTLFQGGLNNSTGTLTKTGSGTVTFGQTASTGTGAKTIRGGTLALDFSQGALTSNILASSAVTLGNGQLQVLGRSGATVSQTLGAVTVGAGGNKITMTPNSGTSTTLTLGTLTVPTTAGASLLISAPSGTTVTTTTNKDAQGVYGGRYVFFDGTNYNWATTASAATPFTLSGLSTYATLALTAGTDTSNSLQTGSGTFASAAARITNSLKLTTTAAGQSLDLATGSLTLTNGGLLFTGANDYSITNGTLKSATATNSDLIVQNYGTGILTIGAGIVNGTGLSTLTTAGTGSVVLTGTNTFTGAVIVGGGTLSFSNTGTSGAGTLGLGVATAVSLGDGATLQYTGSTGTVAASTTANSHTYTLLGGQSSIEVTTAGQILTLSGAIGQTAGAVAGLTKVGAGTLQLNAASTYTGPTIINAGTLLGSGVAFISSSSAVTIGASGTLDINGTAASQTLTIGSLSGTGTILNSNTNTKTLAVGNDNTSTSFGGTFSGASGQALTKVGTGIFTLTSANMAWTGSKTVNGGVLRFGIDNALNASGGAVIANAAGAATLDLNNFAYTAGSLAFGGSSGAATSQGFVTLGTGTLTLGGNVTYTATGNPLPAFITGTGAGNLAMSAARTFTIADSTGAATELTVSVPVTGAFALTKDGSGSLLLSGNNTNAGVTAAGSGTITLSGDNSASTGNTSANSGTLVLDYTTQNNAKINAAGILSLLGGSIVLNGNASANTSQTVASTTFAVGSFSNVTLNAGAGQGLVLNLGALTRAANGGTVRINLPSGTQSATNGVTTTTTNDATTGLVGTGGGWLTVTSGGVTSFATVSGGNIIPVTTTTADALAAWGPGLNVSDSGGYAGSLDTETNVNSIRFNSGIASTVTLAPGGFLRVDSGGILQTSAATGGTTITGGRLGSATGELIFTTDSAQKLFVTSNISGATTVTKSGTGTLQLNGFNTGTGNILIQGGTLEASGGFAIGDTQAIAFPAQGNNLVFSLPSGTETIGNLSGGYTATNTNTTVSIGAGATLTINETGSTTFSGIFSGGATATLVKAGASTLTYNVNGGTGNFTGNLIINAGQITLNGNVTQFPSVAGITLNGPTSVLSLPNDQTTAVGSRINDSATITLNNTAGNLGLYLQRTAGTTNGTETVGQLILNAGQNSITAFAGNTATRIATWNFSNATPLVRNNFSTALLVGPLLGSGANPRGRITFSADPGGSIGGGGAAASATISIYPYFIGESLAVGTTPTTSNVGNSFVTFVSTAEGMRPLDTTTEYTLDAAGFNALAGGTTNNVRFTAGATLTGTASAINSLVLDITGGGTVAGPANTLAITSGAVLSTQAVANTINGWTGISTGGGNYYFYVTDPAGSLTVNPQLTTAAPLVKSGAGNLVLGNATNAFTDIYFNLGSVQADSLSKLGSGTFNFFGGTLKLGAAFDPSTKTMTAGTGGMGIDTNGFNVTIANPIGNGGSGGFTKAGTGTLTFAVSPTYTGNTTAAAGRIVLNGGADNRLPTTSAWALTGGSIQLGDATNGASNQTISELSGASTASAIVGGFSSNSTLTINQNTNTTYLGVIGGAGTNENNIAAVKSGGGTLTLGATASTFTGGWTIKQGTLVGGNIATTFGAGTITIGDSTGSNDATLVAVNAFTYTNPISIAGGNTGGATIVGGQTTTAVVFSGPITLNTHDVILSKLGTTGSATFSGGITGTGNVIIDNLGTTGTITLSTNAINNTGSIKNAGIGATGLTTISASIGSNVTNLTQDSATSNLTLSGASILYTGTTTVNQGILNITGSAGAALTTTGVTVAGGATFNTINTAGQAINLGSGPLSLGVGTGTSTLGIELGSLSAYDSLTTSAAAITANNVKFNITGLSGFGAGTYNLLNAASGLNGASYSLGSVSGSVTGVTLNISSSASQVQLIAAASTGDFYWKGAVSNSWAGLSGLNTNFATDLAGTQGTIDVNGTPGTGSSVIFSANGQTGTSLSTTLDGQFSIKDLTFNNAVGSGPLGAITIATGVAGSNLKLAPTVSTNGINVQTGAPATITISAPVILGADQSWTIADSATVLTVSGGVTGNGFVLNKEGPGTLVFSGAGLSTYNGQTNINGGLVRAATATAFSANSTYNVGAAGTLSINGFAETIGALAGAAGAVVNNNTATAATLTAGGNNASTTFAGTLVDGSTAALGFAKTGTGTLTLSGANTYTGNTNINGGTLNVTGSITGNTASSILVYGAATAVSSVINVSGNMTLFQTRGSNVSGGVAVYNQTAGTVNVTPGATSNQHYLANTGGSYGYFNLTGGTYKINGATGRWSTNGTSNQATPSVGVMYIGGTGFFDHTGAEWFINGYSHGQITVADNGVIDHTGSSAPFAIFMDNTVSGGSYGVLNVAGGAVTTGAQSIRFGNGNVTNATGFVNVDAGTLSTGTAMSINVGTGTGNNAYINFAGGTLKTTAAVSGIVPASTANITFTSTIFGAVNNSAVAGAPSFNGGLIFDANGFNSTLSQPLKGATGVGVTQADLTVAGGTGYVGAPEVIFSSAGVVAGGTPAAGYALISGGSVVGIVITSPGTYTAGTTPTVTLTGGGGTGASVTVGSLATANVSGGLTKIGAGTLTLSGANTYTGGTTVTGGTLAIGVNGALDSTGNVTVNGGTLSMTTFNNTVGTVSLQSGSITGSTGVLTATSDYDLQSGTASAILGGAVGATKTTAGTVTLSGANTFSGVVNVNAGTLAFSASNNLGDASATNTLGVNGGTLSYTGTGAVNLGATRTLKLGSSGGTLDASSGTGALTIAGGIDPTSTGNLTKTGPGTIILGGTNSWNSGANSVTVSDGTLRAGFGTGGIGALNVGATGVMDFRNSLAEALTLGGTSGALTLAGGARLGFELGASGSNDQVNVGLGGTALTGGTITLDFFNLAGFGAGTYNLLTAPSGLSAASYVLGTAPGGFNYTINVTDSLVSLGVVSYVPIYWTGSQSTSWATINPGPLTNWATDAAGTLDYGTTPTTTDTVIFSATNAVGGTITTTLDGSYTLDGVQFINAPTTPATTAVVINQGTGGTLTLAPSSTSGGILVGANGGNVTINAPVVASTAQTWNVDGTGASSLTIAGNVAFNAAVTKNGAGVLTLSGNNSGTGALTLSAGTLNINSATAIGGGTFTIAAGTTINNTSGSAVTLTTSNNMNWNGSFTFTGSNALSFGTGNATLGLNTTVTTTASTLTVNGAIADGGSNRNLTKAGAGTLSAGGNLSIGGNLDVTAGTATFGGSTNTIGGSVSMSGTALTMNGNSTIGNGVSVTAGTATMNGNNTITGSVLVNGGTLTLGGANSISSGVTLSAGTLNVANAGALGTSAMTVNGGTLDNTSGSALALSPSVAEIWNGSFTFAGSNNLDVGSGAVTLNNSITVTTTANTLTVGGVIDDGINVFNLTKAGAGTLVLGGANTYAGSTIIDRGTLRFTTTQSMTVGTNGLTFGAAAGGTTVGTLDLATGVNATFGGTFLVQTNSASANTINIPVGQTLRFNNNFIVGYNSASASTTKLTATGGGTLTIGAAGQPTNLGVNIGNGASAASNAATVDLTGLGTFYANLGTGTFRIGSPTNSAGTATAGSTLILAPTSTIIATTITSDSPDSGVTQALKLGSGTNTLNATTIELGGSTSGRTNGTLDFNGLTGTLVVRNLAGTGRVTNINVQNGATGTGSNVSATVNLLGHNADILATTMTVGGRSAGTTGNGTGSFSFDTGTLDLTTLSVASRTSTTLTTGTVTGTVVLGGGTSTIGTLTMGTNSVALAAGSSTGDSVATVTISGGTNSIATLTMGVNTVGAGFATGSDTNSTLNISGGNTTVTTAFTMGAENSANNAATTVNNAISNLNISGGTLTLAGTTNLTMGSTTLDVNNAATATISITGGTLKVGGNITYAQFAGSTVSNTVTLSGGTLDMDGGTIGATATPVTLNLQSGTLKNLADFNTGAAIVKSTPGVLILDGTNTYAGNTTFAAGGGTIQLGNNNVLPDGTGKGNVDTTNGTLDVNGFSDTINGLVGTGVVTNQLAATTGTLTVGGNNVNSTFSGSMQDGAGVFALGKTGTGTLTLDTTNTYSGGTTISAGTIQVGTGGTTGRLGNGAIANAGTLTFNRSDTYAMDATNLVTGAGAVTLAGGVTVVAVVNNQFSTTGALNFGISNGAATANNLDLTAGSSSFGTALVRTNNATPNTVTVASGNTFGLTGLTLGYDAGSGTGATASNLTVSGTGAMNINNTGATVNISVNQAATNAAYYSTAVLDVSGLGSFTSNVGTFNVGVGTTTTGSGSVLLSNTANSITATTLQIGNSGGNNGNGATSSITLGTGTNTISADTINIGFSKVGGLLKFASTAAGPGTVTIGGKTGAAANITIGSNNGTGTSAVFTGDMDLRGHNATVTAGTLALGIGSNTLTGSTTGQIEFDTGSFTATTVTLGTKSGSGGTGTATGTINLSGGSFTVASGGSFSMASNSAATGSAVGNLNVTGTGSFTSNADIVKTGGANTTANVVLNGAGAVIDMLNHKIGTAGQQVAFSAQQGTLRNLNELNGGATLTKTNAAGTLTLDTANSYLGNTAVTAGVLAVSNGGALGGTTNGTSVTSGAALQVSNNITVSGEALTLNGTGIANDGALRSTSGNNTYAGAITLASDSRINSDAGTLTLSGGVTGSNVNLSVGGAGNVLASSAVSLGAGGLTVDGTGTVTLTAANSFTGATTINGGGTLQLGDGTTGHDGTIGSTSGVTDNGTLVFNRFGTSTAGYAIGGSGGVNVAGPGTQVLTAASTYTGATNVTNGTLKVDGGLGGSLGGTAITVSSGATFLASGATSIGTGTAGSFAINAGGTLSLVDGAINTMTLQNTATGFLSMGLGSILALDITGGGSTTDSATVQALTLTGGNSIVNLTTLGAGTLNNGTYTLLSYAGGSTLNGFKFTFDGTSTVQNVGGKNYTLQTNGSSLDLVVSLSTPPTAYWAGSLGGNWSTVSLGSTNWRTDATSNVDTTAAPGATTDVFFNTTTPVAGNLNTTVDTNLTINSLTFTSAATTPVTVGGSNTLTIAAGSGTGITVQSGSAAHTISTNLALGASQTWTNDSSNLLTVSGSTVSGTNTGLTIAGSGDTTVSASIQTGTGGVTKNGSGTASLVGLNTYTGTTSINGGTLVANTLADGGVASSIGQSGSAASNLVINGGTLKHTGAAQSSDRLFTVTQNGATIDASGTGALTLTNTGSVAMTGTGSRVLTLSGTAAGNSLAAKVGDPSSGATQVTVTGSWTLGNTANDYTGITTVSGGTLVATKLADGGNASSIGASTSAAFNLVINGGTLKYTGSGATDGTTDRSFTVGTAGATLDASGASGSAMKFTSTTAPTLSGSNTARTVTLTGSNTDANTLAAPVGDNGTGATSVNKTGSGTWLLTGANTYTGATNVSQGTLQVGASGTGSTASGSGITVTGTSFTTTGTGGPNDPVLLGGSVAALAGSGTVGGNTVVGSNTVGSVGVIRPGDSAGASNGALNFLGDLTVKDGSQIQMGLTTTSKNDAGFDWTAGNALSYVTTHYNAGSPDATYTNYWQTASGNYDTLKITGNTVLGTGGLAYGTISVSSLGGSFSAGDVFKLIDWAGVGTLHSLAGGGSFNIATDLVLPDISGSSLGWDTSAFDTFGVLVVVPEPGRFMFLLLGLGALIMRRRRRTIQD